MSIEAHKCNAQGCKGFVVFENADFDFNKMTLNDELGAYAFDDPTCRECGKKYFVVPHYIVIDKVLGDFEELESACITAFEKREKERKYEAETDPALRIMQFLINRNYVSHSMRDCFDNLENEIKSLLGGEEE